MAIYASLLLTVFSVCLVIHANKGKSFYFYCLKLIVLNIADQAQQCILGGNGNGLPEFQNYREKDDESNRITRHHQTIITSYKFDCNQMCGNITAWGVDVFQDRLSSSYYIFDFQVWRPSPTVNDSTGTGCYSLVGNNWFSAIPQSDGVAEVTPSPPWQNYIQFQPGDVLGVYIQGASAPTDGVVILTRPSSFTSERVWYASIAPTIASSQNGDCPYSVGSSGVLNTLIYAAPVISVSTGTNFH